MAIKQKIVEESLTGDGSTTDQLLFKGICFCYCAGTFDGATITFEISFDGGTTWLTASDLSSVAYSFTDNASFTFTTHGKGLMRATASSSGASTDVLIKIVE
jgi:hypothetical protein